MVGSEDLDEGVCLAGAWGFWVEGLGLRVYLEALLT